MLDSYYLLFLVSLPPTHCMRKGLLLLLITLGHTTLGRSPLDEWSADLRGLYLYNTQHSQENSCPRRDSNPAIPHSQRPVRLITIFRIVNSTKKRVTTVPVLYLIYYHYI